MGVDGGAFFAVRPRSSNIARTLPNTAPQMKKSPGFKVPFCTRMVATGPRPLSTRSEEHTSELQSQSNLVCRLLLEKKKNNQNLSSISVQDNISLIDALLVRL